MRALRFASVVASLAVSACGLGHTETTPDASPGADAAPGPPCPAAVPTYGAACPQTFGGQCEYGSDPNFRCNELVACAGGVWTPVLMGEESTGPICPTPRDPQCPNTEGDVPIGVRCSERTTCGYATGVCDCTEPEVPTGVPLVWSCDRPDITCPQTRPHVGARCTTDGQTCDYGSCTIPEGVGLACADGTWQGATIPCPL